MKPPQMLSCHTCGHLVSPQAQSCPKCAQPFALVPQKSVASGVFNGLLAFFVLLPIAVVCGMLGLGSVIQGCDSSRKRNNERIVAEAESKRQIALRAVEIEAQKRREEYERSPEGLAAQQKLEADRREQERLAQQQAEAAEYERQRPARERTAKILAYQLDRASNGYPSFQIEIGKRYLTGDGVETNLALAKHWLQSACTNGEPMATNLLSQLK